MARNVIRIDDDALKLLKQGAKIYGLDESETAEKYIKSGASRLASLRKDSAKRVEAGGATPRKKKAKKEKKVAKRVAKAASSEKTASAPKRASKGKGKGIIKKAKKSLADRANAARNGTSQSATV